MRFAVAAGMTVPLASGLWSSDVAAATPQKGGKFRVGVHDGNTSDTFDPGTYLSVGSIQLSHAHRSYLTEITPENTLGPDMADSWSASPDARVWTFELSKNATFHNGKKFTSKDAVASLNHHRGEASTSAAKALLSTVVDIKARGDHAIVIELNQGSADLPYFMTDYHLAICPAKADGTIEWDTMIGAGPYKIVDHKPGISTNLVRHDGWHRKGAYFDELELLILNDANARQTALITGDVDAITSVDLKTMALMARNKKLVVENVASGSAITLPMFCDVDPYKDVNVRLALKYSVNRDELVEKIMFGTATVGNDYHVSSGMPFAPTDIPQRPYDPDKAKFHLKKAGVSSLNVDLSAADSILSGAVDMCVLYSEHAKKAGININVIREANDGYWADVWLKKPWCFVKWGARPTPDQMFSLAYKDDAPWNESHWQNKRFNELLLIAKAELDEKLRAEQYREMCQ
ncbi:MAG: ABC transporter substrate-binding protein, partial [Gammaproteobacteria bacterium]|nr:ABC transporter substrate-binding protein [Gammaproteobacteria bacterium]